MVAEYGVQPGNALAWRCDDVGMELVPVAELRTPASRGLDAERLRNLLRGIAAGVALPAVPVFREPDAVVVLNGMHRLAIARAAGFTHIPCLTVSLDEARDFYGYPEGQA
jgi:ParB-like chromosome segregation protein Spo0J